MLHKLYSLFARLISHQPAVLFSQNEPASSNQPAVLFSQSKPAPAISHQPTEQARLECPKLLYSTLNVSSHIFFSKKKIAGALLCHIRENRKQFVTWL
jgi:hypothetical protein